MKNLREFFQNLFCTSLQRRENRLRQVANSVAGSHSTALITDRRGNIQYVNAAFCAQNGFEQAELLGQNAKALLAKAPAPEAKTQLLQALKTGSAWQGQLLITRKTSRPCWQEILLLPVFRKNEVDFFLAIGTDLTECKASQAALQRRVEELALINTISLAAASHQFDLEALMETIGRSLENAFQVKSVFIALYDEKNGLISAPYWSINRQRVHAAPFPYGQGLTSRVIATRQPLLIETDFETQGPALGAKLIFAQASGLPKTWLGIPLPAGEKVIGVISLQDYEHEKAFQPEDIRLLTTIAANLAVALQNAQLFQANQQEILERKHIEAELRHQAEAIRLFHKISQELSSRLDLTQLLQNLMEKCRQALPFDVFYVALYDASSQMIYYPLFFDKEQFKNVPARDLHTTPGLTGEIIFNRKTLHLPDALDPNLASQYQIIHTSEASSRCFVGVPMFVQSRVLGVLSIQSYQPNFYSLEQIRFIEELAVQTALAIDTSRAYEKLHAETLDLQQTQEHLTETNHALQTRLARIEAAKSKLREQAIRDPLTRLYNRRYLDEVFAKKMEQAHRKASPLSVIMFDIDHFKQFNDQHGHNVGDHLLSLLGKHLRSQTRSTDIACRFGGEEFLILLPQTELKTAIQRAEEIRQGISDLRLETDGKTLQITISAGVACAPDHAHSPEELIIQADQAMYAAKQAGRNRVVTWHE